MIKIVKMVLGFCPCCKKRTVFVATDYWLRDFYRCLWCRSIPRQRAIMRVLKEEFPGYKKLKIHESSPSGATFRQLRKECNNYSYSYFYNNHNLGEEIENGATNQNIENLNFEDNTFDIFITQDVMEHVANPGAAFFEIARVLKPGGVHIFTTPIYCFSKSQSRIKIQDGHIVNVLPEIYHGNPICKKGSLVTWDWGYDIIDFIEGFSGLKSEIITFQNSKLNHRQGLEADFLEVVVSRKRI